MAKATRKRWRSEAQELMWQAMEIIDEHETRAAALCKQALRIYPDCVDALTMLAEIECATLEDYVAALRRSVDAGRRDLGPEYFSAQTGYFWGLIETRPFMRAMADLVFALLAWGTPERIDEAIRIQEQMLELNPNDNQGMRDILAASYLRQKRYDDAARLLERYKDDWMAVPCWSRVLLALATESEASATRLLKAARKQNPHVEQYLTGQRRRPRSRPGSYSPGAASEAVFCADTLWKAWKAHPKATKWLKAKCAAST
jgi:tetratricopeptide (TPR) repeat protein